MNDINEKKYQIIITNKLSADQDKNLVIQNLASLFKIDKKKAARLLDKSETVIKEITDKAVAEKLLAAIRTTGTDCRIVDSSSGGYILREKKQPQLEEIDNSAKKHSCPECGTDKDSYADVCLHCGFDQLNPNVKSKSKFKSYIKYISIILILTTSIIIAYPFALPFYNTYSGKYKVANGLELAFDTRNKITSFILETNFWPNQNIDANLPKQISNEVIESIVVGENAVTTVTLRAEAVNADSNKTIIFKPTLLNERLVWNCTKGTLDNEFRPGICKSNNQ